MGALDALAGNPVTDFLGLQSNIKYATDVTMFFYALHVLRSNKRGSNFLSTFVMTFVRAFGAIGFALPLVLGKLPGDVLSGMDAHAQTVIFAMVWDFLNVTRSAPAAVNDVLRYFQQLCYSVVKANVCAQGYAAAGGAFGGSTLAPFVGAYVAVQGHNFVENGVSSINNNTFGEDGLLGVLGGVFLWAGAKHLDIAGSMANVCLAVFHFTNEWVPWTKHFADFLGQVEGALAGVGGGGGGRRSRSRTPTRKNR